METLTTAFVLIIVLLSVMIGFTFGGLFTYAIMLEAIRPERKRKHNDCGY